MTIEYTGRQTEVPPPIKSLAERKLRKLGRVLRGITHVHVILTVDKHRQIAEVSVHSPHLDLTAAEETTDLAVSVSNVLDKLFRQAERHVGRRQERKRRGAGRSTALWSGVLSQSGGDGQPGPRVIRSRRFIVKPMTVEEAVLEVGATDDGLLVFRDASTEKVSVLYKRKDGNLGLIEPEA
jgi:ribosome hibernation promoting factor